MIIIEFLVSSVLLGVALAMDAFSVSMANGLNEPNMKTRKRIMIASVFAGFQFLMPLIGWFMVHTIIEIFSILQMFVPWVGFVLLIFIGGKMILNGVMEWNGSSDETGLLRKRELFVQGIATSIDALSVGFTISDYSIVKAIMCAMIILIVTFFICLLGLRIGRYFGVKLAGKASFLGGMILVGIAIHLII